MTGLEHTNAETGEVVRDEVTPHPASAAMETWLDNQNTVGALGTLLTSAEEAARLMAEFTDEEWDILPTGEVYVNHMRYRTRLSEVFGPGGWTMRPVTAIVHDENGHAHQRWEMWVRGAWFATAVGSARYGGGDNDRWEYADMAESIKSNALTRMCKDIPMGADLYDRERSNAWKQRHAIQVDVRQKSGQPRSQWRRRSRDPFPYEMPSQSAGTAEPMRQAVASRPRHDEPEERRGPSMPGVRPATQAAMDAIDAAARQMGSTAPPPAPARRPTPAPEPAHREPAPRTAAPKATAGLFEFTGVVSDVKVVTKGNNAKGEWVMNAVVMALEDGTAMQFKLFSSHKSYREILDIANQSRLDGSVVMVGAKKEVRGRFTDYMLEEISL